MTIPLNGRIAIVDDKIEQARPLMNLFSKLQIPYVYYDSNLKNLPAEDSATNDIRILFLDINLIDDSVRKNSELKAKLVPTLNRILSQGNYPYLLVYWSRNEKEHASLVKEIFKNDLPTKAPIDFLSLKKSDYFKLDGSRTELHHEKLPELFKRIESSVNKYPIYKHLLEWENIIHKEADNTLEVVFKPQEIIKEWDKFSKYLFYKLAHSYSGKKLKEFEALEQIKSGFYSLNFIFNDSLEFSISNNFQVDGVSEKLESLDIDNHDILYTLNKKILFSYEHGDKFSPGIVFQITNNGSVEKHGYGDVLNNWINRDQYYLSIKKTIDLQLKGLRGKARTLKERKLKDAAIKELRDNIRKDWTQIEANVTPICDHVQGKIVYYRLVPGLLINSKYLKHFNGSSEAVFISPVFKHEKSATENYFLLLDFRLLTSIPKSKFEENMRPIFRIRQLLLSEIQSKLSRHINRQGILFLE